MMPAYDYKKFAILYVDDEEKSLTAFARAFGDEFRILTANNAQDGFRLLEAHRQEIGLLMTDQRMPGEKGVWLLEQARRLEPRILRVLVTAFTDYKDAIDAINTGAIYKYISKPWDVPTLELTLKQALEFFMVQHERDELLREKLSVIRNMTIADRILSLGLLAAGLSHHIRNALVAVKTFLDLAPAKLAEENVDLNALRDPEFWREYHRNVQWQIEKINHLLHQLWSASETSSLAFNDEVRLGAVVRAELAKLESDVASRQLSVTLDIPDELPPLCVDKPRFCRLFELLLKDELATLPVGSRLAISARPVEGLPADRAQVEIHIQDNGPGLPAETLRLIFDPFVSRGDNPAEFGVNLMACYFIVHHHGGTIHAVSEPGGGTTFKIRLPFRPSNTNAVPTDTEFLHKAVLNDELWHRLAASSQPPLG